jgi:hypothetical protein
VERVPGVVYVSINCYGHDGPWSARRGWEGLAQAATGLAVPRADGGPPRLAPGSVFDYLTGYLAARGVMEALLLRSEQGGSWHVRASLCQTGMWLAGLDPLDESAARLLPTSTPISFCARKLPMACCCTSRRWTSCLRHPRTGTGRRHAPDRMTRVGELDASGSGSATVGRRRHCHVQCIEAEGSGANLKEPDVAKALQAVCGLFAVAFCRNARVDGHGRLRCRTGSTLRHIGVGTCGGGRG